MLMPCIFDMLNRKKTSSPPLSLGRGILCFLVLEGLHRVTFDICHAHLLYWIDSNAFWTQINCQAFGEMVDSGFWHAVVRKKLNYFHAPHWRNVYDIAFGFDQMRNCQLSQYNQWPNIYVKNLIIEFDFHVAKFTRTGKNSSVVYLKALFYFRV